MLKIKATIVYTQRFTGSFHAIMHHRGFFAVPDKFRQLPHVRRSRKVEDDVFCE